MVSKREKKKWRRVVEDQAGFLDLKLRDLMVKEMEDERRTRRKLIRSSKKRRTDYIV